MTLTEIRKLLESLNLDDLVLRQIRGQAGFENLDRFRTVAVSLAEVPGLATFAQPLLQGPIFQTSQATFLVGDQWTQLLEYSKGFASAAKALREVIAAVTCGPSADAIRVRFACTSDFRSLIEYQEKLIKALDQLLLNKSIGGQVTIKGWEKGSWWVDLGLGSLLAVAVVGSAVWAAAVIRKKIVEGDILIAQARAVNAKADVVEHLAEKVQEGVDATIQAESLAIYEKHFNGEENHEQVERIKLSVKLFTELIQQGAEVHPSLMEPEKAENLFPAFEKLNAIVSKIPQLAEASEKQT